MKHPSLDRLVFVEWVDAWTSGHWVDQEEIPDCRPETIYTVGFIIKENDKGIMLAQSYGSGFGNVWFVPNEDVVSVRQLRPGKEV